jgi:hypothetical protein
MPAARLMRGKMLTPSLKLSDGNNQTNPVLIYRFTFFAFCFFPSYLLIAQGVNLVPNGSFEDRDLCIYNDSYVEDAYPWFNPQSTETFLPATPDLFHACANVNEDPCPYPEDTSLDLWLIGVPTNFVGCQTPKEGNGYAGGFFYYPNPDLEEGYREYLAVPLSETLMAGIEYTLSFSTSLAERSGFAIWNVGALLTADSLLQPEYGAYIDHPLQFQGTPGTYLNDKNVWYDLEWTFEALGGEKYLYIGNFQPNSETDTISAVSGSMSGHYPGSCYYVDDVKLYASVLSTSNTRREWIQLYPNPVTNLLSISIKHDVVLSISIVDLRGKELFFMQAEKSKNFQVDLSHFASGLYLIQMTDANGKFNFTEKIVKR